MFGGLVSCGPLFLLALVRMCFAHIREHEECDLVTLTRSMLEDMQVTVWNVPAGKMVFM